MDGRHPAANHSRTKDVTHQVDATVSERRALSPLLPEGAGRATATHSLDFVNGHACAEEVAAF